MKRRVPLGRPIKRRTEAQLEEAAIITAADIEEARALWKRHAGRKYRNLLDAEVEEQIG